MRTIIDLPDDQIRALRELCEREHISRAEAIRRAVARLLAEEAVDRKQHALDQSFGAWKDRADEARGAVREARAEWNDN